MINLKERISPSIPSHTGRRFQAGLPEPASSQSVREPVPAFTMTRPSSPSFSQGKPWREIPISSSALVPLAKGQCSHFLKEEGSLPGLIQGPTSRTFEKPPMSYSLEECPLRCQGACCGASFPSPYHDFLEMEDVCWKNATVATAP